MNIKVYHKTQKMSTENYEILSNYLNLIITTHLTKKLSYGLYLRLQGRGIGQAS